MSDILSQLDPQYASDQIDLQRRMALAQALREQSMSSMGPTQAIGGVAIRQSPWEGMAKIGQALASNHLDTKNKDERLQAGQQHMKFLMDMLNGNQQPQTSLPVYPQQSMNSGAPMTGSLTNQAIANMPQSQGGGLPLPQQPQQPLPLPQQPQQPQGQTPFGMSNLIRAGIISDLGGKGMGDAYASQYTPTPEQKNYRSGLTQALAGIDVQKAGEIKRAELPYGEPTQVTMPDGSVRLMTPAQKIKYAGGGLSNPKPTSPSNNPQPPGGAVLSPDQAKVNEAKATAAIQAANIQEKSKPLLSAIDEAIQLNPSVPYGSLGGANAQVTASNINLPDWLGGGGSGKAATGAERWKQLTGTAILNGIQDMQGAGAPRMSGGVIDAIKEQRGIPMESHPAARLKALQDLRKMVLDNVAAAKNVVPALNQPGITTNTQQVPMQNDSSGQNKVVDFGSLK
jgi:hypothetical protein